MLLPSTLLIQKKHRTFAPSYQKQKAIKMNRNYQQKRTVRFRYWTRKGYAAFSSLGLCVTIGQLRKNVTEQSLTKQVGCNLLLPTNATAEDSQIDPKERETLPALNEELLLALLYAQAATTSTPPTTLLLLDHINHRIDAPNAFCRSLFPIGKRRGKTHSAYLYSYPPYLS